ncbi:hypothetical protein GCM10009087_22420 [Sphingomonas oligophenolica]
MGAAGSAIVAAAAGGGAAWAKAVVDRSDRQVAAKAARIDFPLKVYYLANTTILVRQASAGVGARPACKRAFEDQWGTGNAPAG